MYLQQAKLICVWHRTSESFDDSASYSRLATVGG